MFCLGTTVVGPSPQVVLPLESQTSQGSNPTAAQTAASIQQSVASNIHNNLFGFVSNSAEGPTTNVRHSTNFSFIYFLFLFFVYYFILL